MPVSNNAHRASIATMSSDNFSHTIATNVAANSNNTNAICQVMTAPR